MRHHAASGQPDTGQISLSRLGCSAEQHGSDPTLLVLKLVSSVHFLSQSFSLGGMPESTALTRPSGPYSSLISCRCHETGGYGGLWRSEFLMAPPTPDRSTFCSARPSCKLPDGTYRWYVSLSATTLSPSFCWNFGFHRRAFAVQFD